MKYSNLYLSLLIIILLYLSLTTQASSSILEKNDDVKSIFIKENCKSLINWFSIKNKNIDMFEYFKDDQYLLVCSSLVNEKPELFVKNYK